ncbi:hypothetical protein [Phreatobacter stygius]|uniref:Uncharacterized protein n=1 Tax=Phreatobacter stygius TaxID=1940610 RepID=A0A4D7ASV2_9HYPH|nr:hypothetical protein [Phreatobacter stygius]QCI64584.1 hypothetical protein E8M01_10295 [Phreatobacter stygius]
MNAVGQSFLKPEVVEVHEFLRRHCALIVHFSGTPGGADPDSPKFPDDLTTVIGGQAKDGVCCSVVKPGDTFDGFDRHAFGTVGVILDLNAKESLATADPGDGGSFRHPLTGIRQFNERDLTTGDAGKESVRASRPQ